HARAFMEEVRERVLDVFDAADVSPGGDRLNSSGFVWDLLIAHEQQHNETMLQTLRLAGSGVYSPPVAIELPRAGLAWGETIRIPAGPFAMGAPADGFAYDNERPRQVVDLPAFEIDRLPVTNGAYMEFVE